MKIILFIYSFSIILEFIFGYSVNNNNQRTNLNTSFDSNKNIKYNLAYSSIAALNYNPLNIWNKSFISNFNIEPNSLYINYKLSKEQINEINYNIPDYLEIIPIKLFRFGKKKYLISINVYYVSSFLFGNNLIPRLECNIYVKDKRTNNIGTMIIDYTSPYISFDPINLFKISEKNEEFNYHMYDNKIKIKSKNNKFYFEIDTIIKKRKFINLSTDLIKITDNIYYQNGIIEKLYYDSAFIYNKVYLLNFNKNFNMLNFIIPGSNSELFINKIDSAFLFPQKLTFTCKTWSNRNSLIN